MKSKLPYVFAASLLAGLLDWGVITKPAYSETPLAQTTEKATESKALFINWELINSYSDKKLNKRAKS
ncbi:hypothetical protein L2E67_08650 [Planktothrix agardhii 1803]|uniref:hypothetical protein n=1 Tax=Planktothrix agardhii TaxID=1160 RepID=UPI001F3582ED|nr:hypothetical protein [Planktothrix agardhii]MCF3571959.1 hypothetical protein [Planktothrix agardhii 1805]MCF3585147.1 hypothetical protein [Planktothrix agardhii 1803]